MPNGRRSQHERRRCSFAVQARGGKFIQYAGMADSIVTPLSSCDITRPLCCQGQATLAQIQQFYRLSCSRWAIAAERGSQSIRPSGGAGDAEHDMVVALEHGGKGTAPTRIVATKFIPMTRQRCGDDGPCVRPQIANTKDPATWPTLLTLRALSNKVGCASQ